MPVVRAVLERGVFNIDMTDIQNLLYCAKSKVIGKSYEYTLEDDFSDSFEDKLKVDIRNKPWDVKGVMICIRGKNLKYYQVQ